jgi:glycosyltransferase involved in cell wall biosynthesis
MAAGLPVVATDDENRRAIIGDAGIFVDPTDIQAYANAIKQALETDFDNKPIIQAAHYSWDQIIVQYQEVLDVL